MPTHQARHNVLQILQVFANESSTYFCHSSPHRLCKPETNKRRGAPFRLVKAQAVDMFPQTEGMELVFMLERD